MCSSPKAPPPAQRQQLTPNQSAVPAPLLNRAAMARTPGLSSLKIASAGDPAAPLRIPSP